MSGLGLAASLASLLLGKLVYLCAEKNSRCLSVVMVSKEDSAVSPTPKDTSLCRFATTPHAVLLLLLATEY